MGLHSKGRLLGLHGNITQGGRRLTNKHVSLLHLGINYDQKNLNIEANIIKIFILKVRNFLNKLERLSLASLSSLI
jgi:hypothetical protein